MLQFRHGRFDLSYLDEGAGPPVVLVHGFASSARVNWLTPGWVETLVSAGYRVLAPDNRGHGGSTKSHDSADYTPEAMADDVLALADHAGLGRFHLMGYSMGARISAYAALIAPERLATLALAGLGIHLVDGLGDWDAIAEALLASDPADAAPGRPRMFRDFADRTRSDRLALAACIASSRKALGKAEVARIATPTLIAVGTRDDIAGDPHALAALMPGAVAYDIDGRDHMLSVGDRRFKARYLQFLSGHPA